MHNVQKMYPVKIECFDWLADCLKGLCFHSLDSSQQSKFLDFAEYKFRCRCQYYIHHFYGIVDQTISDV